jgi:hypothetical protein
VEPIRVVLVALPEMLDSLIADVVRSQADMLVVGSFVTCSEFLADPPRSPVDAAVVGLGRGALAPAFDDVMRALGRVRCLTVSDDGKEAFLYAGALSLDDLLAVIRGKLPLPVPLST